VRSQIEHSARIAPSIRPIKPISINQLRPIIFLSLLFAATSSLAESTCYGTTSNGKIDGAVQLPANSANFSAYSEAGVALGRTYLHAQIVEIVVATYRELAQSLPDTKFVYGETGWRSGGSFKPHRTHQNGLSVDFFVPVLNREGRSVALPTNITNKFGYEIEFDSKAKFREYRIDFNAIAEHLYSLDIASKKYGAPIKLVIFELSYLPRLFTTKRGAYLKANVKFMQTRAWVPHDEHYHVDFEIACQPMPGKKSK
jgi:penicillin-insensitive murein DD-endopeptidase